MYGGDRLSTLQASFRVLMSNACVLGLATTDGALGFQATRHASRLERWVWGDGVIAGTPADLSAPRKDRCGLLLVRRC